MLSNIDNGYASVLFELGKKNNHLKQYYDWAMKMLPLLEHNPDFITYLSNSNIDKVERRNSIKDVLSNVNDQTFIYFMWSIIDFGRSHNLIEIIKLFLQECQKYYGISYVSVTTVEPLTNKTKKQLEKALIKGLGYKSVIINNEIDPTLIAGIKIKTHSISIDDSIRNKLNKMKTSSFHLIQQGE